MPSNLILGLLVALLGALSGTFAPWLEARYGKVNRAYFIQAALDFPILIGLILYQYVSRNGTFFWGYYMLARFAAIKIYRFRTKQR